MRISNNQSFLDFAGILTSAICIVHCLFLPVLLSLSAFSSYVFLENPLLENTVLLVGAVLGMWSLFPAYLKHHRKLYIIIILMIGFSFIGLSRFMVNVNESVFTSTGAALVASAHFLNFRLCRNYHK